MLWLTVTAWVPAPSSMASSTAVTVTVRGVFQPPVSSLVSVFVVKVSLLAESAAPLTVTPSPGRTVTTTLPAGCVFSLSVYSSERPSPLASVTPSVVGATITPWSLSVTFTVTSSALTLP